MLRTPKRSTSLQRAAWYGHEATIGLLLDRETEIEAKSSRVQTLLHLVPGADTRPLSSCYSAEGLTLRPRTPETMIML